MATWGRWMAGAVASVVFGVAGGAAGMLVMADQLRGEVGPAGPPGDQGEQGDPGPPGDVANAPVIGDMQYLDRELLDGLTDLELRVDELEQVSEGEYRLTDFNCFSPFESVEVVTDIRVVFGELQVDRERICIEAQ